MRRALDWLPAFVLLSVLGGCRTTAGADTDGCAKDTDCKGSRVCVSGRCVEPGAPGSVAAAASAVPTGDTRCEVVVPAFRKVVLATGSESHKAALPAEAEDIRLCKEQHWPTALLDCAAKVSSVDAYFKDCAKAAFKGDIELKPERELPAGAALEKDGDFSVYKKAPDGKCGMLLKRVEPVSAIFVVCGERVIAGPLTTPDEVKGVTRELSDKSRAAHEIRARIVQNWPSGGGARYKVYDSRGRFVRTE